MLRSKYTPRIPLIILFLMLWLMGVMSQVPYIQKIRFSIPVTEPVFTRALQDSQGYIWLGSDNGLFRFDGVSFIQFVSPVDSAGFHVTAIHEAKNGIIWIGCRDGRIYHIIEGIINQFNPEEGTSGKSISDIVTDKDGILWWSSTGEGIYYFYDNRVYNINSDDGLAENYVYDLEPDQDGLIWAGTDAGIVACRQEKGRKIIVPFDFNTPLPDIIVRVVKKDQDGRLWLGFQDGGTGYIMPGRTGYNESGVENAWSFGTVQDMAVLRDAVWIATASGELVETGLDRVAGEKQYIKRLSHERFGKINDLLEDQEGNVWILSHNGLFCSSGTRMKFLKPDLNDHFENIHSVRNDLRDHDRLWFSNDKGLFLLNLSDGSIKQFLEGFHKSDLKVNCLFQDNLGFIWAGTFNYGVFRVDPVNGTWIQITEEQGLVNNNVLSISGHNDTLWMATLGGASEIILQGRARNGPFSIISHNRDNGLVNNFIYSVFEDTHDQIWFATDGDGISVRAKGSWISYNEKSGLGDDVIYSISGDKYDNIWIATASNGIYKFKGNRFNRYGINEGISSLEITGIITAGDEVIIILNDGLDILHIPTGRIVHYGDEVGLADISPDLNVFSKDQAGNVWIGTRTGIIRYQPGVNPASYGPRTVLEEMSVYLEPMEMKKGHRLSYRENHVSFKYAGLWFSNPEKVTYQVMLEGYDLGWKDTYDRSVTYSSLPPGNYSFHVRSALDGSFSNASEVTYEFRIKGPFWLDPLFLIAVIAFLAALVYFFVRYREERMRRIGQEKKEKVEFEFQVLKNQVNPHFLFNSFSTLMSLIEEQPEQAVQYTEKLSDFFRTILQLKEQDVIPLDDELNLIENYFFLLKKRFGDNLNLVISLGKGTEKLVIPPMTLQILIENAVKHNVISRDKPLHIRIYKEDRMIIVENDIQPKKTAEISTGIGLENIVKRYRLITKTEPVIERTDAVFRVKLPVIR